MPIFSTAHYLPVYWSAPHTALCHVFREVAFSERVPQQHALVSIACFPMLLLCETLFEKKREKDRLTKAFILDTDPKEDAFSVCLVTKEPFMMPL